MAAELEEPRSGKVYDSVENIESDVATVKTLLVFVLVFVVLTNIIFSGFLFYLLSMRP